MSEKSRVRVYIACSIDGFIAGVDGDLSWLEGSDPPEEGQDPPPPPTPESGAMTYAEFTENVGAMLMGRATYDAVIGFDVGWPYEIPVLVATTRPIDNPPSAGITAVSGSIDKLITKAIDAAAGKDVYLDGGNLIRQGLDAGLVDELVVTMVPVVLGAGHALFAGATKRHQFEFGENGRYGTMLQYTLHPKR
ncbi:MAG: dihydrofolate reductase family protein [Chloroflexota bacterium]